MPEMIMEPTKLATCPYFSTTNCPNKFDSVAPSPKHDAVSPTGSSRRIVSDWLGDQPMSTKMVHLLTTLNLPEPNEISATRYGWTSPHKPAPKPSRTCVDRSRASPESRHRMINAHRIGKEIKPAKNSGLRPTPQKVNRSAAYVANAMVTCAVTIAPAMSGIADLRGSPSSPFPISSPRTSSTFALAKLQRNTS